MRYTILIACLLISLFAKGQIKTQQVANTALPNNIHYQGKALQAMQYQDKTGSYLALITQTGVQPQKGDDEFKQAHLYGYVYQLNAGAAPKVLWQLHDFVTDCNLDMAANFVNGTFAITDLDKNGEAEVWLGYRLCCRGDVSPSDFKIIMHEGTKKYAKRGTGRIKVGNAIQPDGGTITSDDFKTAKSVFAQYAGKLWQKHLTEVIQ